MGLSRKSFDCAACGAAMERVETVPVLQSLAAHAVHRCGECGHILLVPERAGEWTLGWLDALDGPAISCAAFL